MKKFLIVVLAVLLMSFAYQGRVSADLTSETYKTEFVCTGGTTYDFDFKIFDEDDIEVVYIDTDGVEEILTLTTDYTISLLTSIGGRITTEEAYADGELVARRNQLATQDIDYTPNDILSTTVLERQLDEIVMMVQGLKEQISRSLLGAATQDTAITFPSAESDKLIGWNTDADGLENKVALDADVQAAAEAAQAAAEAAQTAAELAETNAEAAATSIPDMDTDGTLAANSDSKIATQKATKTYADKKLASDGTGGRVIRQSFLQIQDGTNADTIKCTIASRWNGDVVAVTDNIAKNATTGNYFLSADGTSIGLLDSGITGSAVAVTSVVITGSVSGTFAPTNLDCWTDSGNIYFNFPSDATAISSGTVTIIFTYVTSA